MSCMARNHACETEARLLQEPTVICLCPVGFWGLASETEEDFLSEVASFIAAAFSCFGVEELLPDHV